jgi:hypothetical protein
MKKATSIRMTEEGLGLLKKLAAAQGISCGAAMEVLVRGEAAAKLAAESKAVEAEPVEDFSW